MKDKQGGVRRQKVLVVDDDASIRMVVMSALRRTKEYDLHEASDGAVAKAMLQQQAYDLVITDLVMPNMDGVSLMQWARKHCPGPTWIILSGRTTVEDAIKAVRLGAFDFITKPLAMIDSLAVTVHNALHQRDLEAEHRHLDIQLQQRNAQLSQQVANLKDACRMLCEQAETMGEDLRRAAIIQRAMLPQWPPRLDAYAVDATYRPSRKVGGDLYDVSIIAKRYLLIYVADAAGHGVSAAMLAVLFKHRLHLIDETTGQPTSPAQILSLVNQALITECSRPGLFIPATFCVLDMETGQLSLASAGHPPTLLHRAGGGVEVLPNTGPALGTRAGAQFTETSLELQRDDRLLLYTDGLFQASEASEPLTRDDLTRLLGSDRVEGADLLTHLLRQAQDRRGPASQEDDITMVMVSAERRASTLDNGSVAIEPKEAESLTPPRHNVLMGHSNGETTIRIDGRGVWTHCPAFHQICLLELTHRRPLHLDLSRCEYLDSTFLGTIQEVVDEAEKRDVTMQIHGVQASVREMFDELGMSRVVSHFSADPPLNPPDLSPLEPAGDEDQYRRYTLKAHEALAALNEQNRKGFLRLIEGLRAEIARATASV